MYFYKTDILFQEVPGEISLAFYISGCPLKCHGCHSPELWTEKNSTLLTTDFFLEKLHQYKGLISCILFLGGEWYPQQLIEYLKLAENFNYKTALYTGLDDVSPSIKDHLIFLKTGPWNQDLGGLDSKNTNQIFKNLKTGQILNHLFLHQP